MPHLVATALTGAALALLPAEAAAAPAPPADRPPAAAPATSLRLTLSHPGEGASGARSVTLQCDPLGGTHPRAAQACADLARSGGEIEREPAGDTACTMIYAPVIAEARGHWRGRPVSFRAEYANDCVLGARTGAIFRF
ncbi:SSI family serine proteinase inhibitor [Spirillospora sp. NPDC029432]|uniref:SSI family serine proteinase inhibitor n=1 Tax=Spirillospora sp. NPDC029432 TaxID=3154599 RepID=UPI003451ACDD